MNLLPRHIDPGKGGHFRFHQLNSESFPGSITFSLSSLTRGCDKSLSSVRSPPSTMVSPLHDLFLRLRYTRGSGLCPKLFAWRSYFAFTVVMGFLVVFYRTYMPPPRPWPMHPVEEGEFDVPDRNVNWSARANAVRQAFAHAYSGYETYAFPQDELLPLTNTTEMK